MKDKHIGINSKPKVTNVKTKSNGVNITPKPKAKVDRDTPAQKPLMMYRNAVVSRAYKRTLYVAMKVDGQPKAIAAERARETRRLAALAWDQEQ